VAIEHVDVQAASKPSRKAGLTLLPFFPRIEADLPSRLFRIEDTIDLSFDDQVADLAIAEAALEALKAEHGNPPVVSRLDWKSRPSLGILSFP
jgi:hypothetical protein